MFARLGFVASVLSRNLTTSRTCRLSNATGERLRELVAENLAALDEVVTYLGDHDIRLYRVSSNLIPFASHPVNQVRWWEEFAPQLDAIGLRLHALGVRVSTHPGQYTVLNSPHSAIVRASIAELEYQARLLDLLGADDTGKIVLHIGGLYGSSEAAAMERFRAAAADLSDAVRRRLVVENDDRLFDAEEALWVAERVGVPVVFDWLHHAANPCRASLDEVLPAIFATWKRQDGPPKLHLSSQAAQARIGAHARYIDIKDALALLAAAPDAPFDCMLEAKEKERALLKLRRDLRRRGILETGCTPPRPVTPPGAPRPDRSGRRGGPGASPQPRRSP